MVRRWVDTPRKRVVVLSLLCWLFVLIAIDFIKVPYVRLAPGPVFDVLAETDGEPVITVAGAQVYATDGRLDMTTVSERGGPFGALTLFEAFTGWLDPAVVVVPISLLYPPDTTGDEAEQAGQDAFADSQEKARIAALEEVGKPVETRPWVVEVLGGSPAEGILEHGDVVLAVDGAEVAGPDELAEAVRARGPGASVGLDIRRADVDRSVEVTTIANPEDPTKGYLGLSLGVIADSPIEVGFNLDDVGGPSAGLVFALGIVDKLTPGQLLDGRTVAGTGTMDYDGTVGPIGGIEQKMAAARDNGATLFLAPKANCPEAAQKAPDGLTVAAVDSLSQAVAVLEGTIQPPACPVG